MKMARLNCARRAICSCMIRVSCTAAISSSGNSSGMPPACSIRCASCTAWSRGRVTTIFSPVSGRSLVISCRRISIIAGAVLTAPWARSASATLFPSASGWAMSPINSECVMRLPSGLATKPRIRSLPFFTSAKPPSGTWQLPASARLRARSASTQAAVSGWCSGCSKAITSARSARHSMPSAPCPTAGRLSSLLINARMRWPSPRRFSPAAARMMAAYCPSSSLRKRVCTLPRNGSILRCGKRARNWLSRRRLEVPTTLPAGNAARFSYLLETNASCGSSRSPMAASTKPSGRFIGTSFSECTARSARPSSSAVSSSFTNRPLPPILERVTSRIWSPCVVMPNMLTSVCGYNARSLSRMCCACHIASALSRDAITKREGADGNFWLIGFPKLSIGNYPAHSNIRCAVLSSRTPMNLFSAPTDISSKDLPLRDDVRLLGRILGDTLREQEGEASFQLIENVRRAAVRFRKTQDDRDRVQLERTLDALSPSETLVVVRAFSYFSQLSNIAEDLHHNRRHRAHLKAGSAPKDGSLLLALERIEAKHTGKKALQTFLDSALISPVLTAHPTEVQRKSILDCQLNISRLLSDRDRVEMTPDELADNEEALRRFMLILWQTRMLRTSKLTVH